MSSHQIQGKWQFWIDRGGTFTDIVARRPDGHIVVHKLLSENPEQYRDAAVAGIRTLMGLAGDAPIPSEAVEIVKLGTTVATNALLERKGEPTVLLITQGFGDALAIGYQNRPDLFALGIEQPPPLYTKVIEVKERVSAQGEILVPLDLAALKPQLAAVYNQGIRSCAIVFVHGYRYPDHEQQVAALAREMGFTQVSVSHEVSGLIKLVSRGDTTVVDAYLSPVLGRYLQGVQAELGEIPLYCMQSNGGVVAASCFRGKDSLLSGPAGGMVGVVRTALAAGIERLIGLDMGGTSTDVCHYRHNSDAPWPEYERWQETTIAGVRLRSPLLAVHTVAAGGGSILRFDQGRYQVGPESAGANPGPAAYRRGGPLTITDANLLLGKIQPAYFPAVFGADGQQPLDRKTVEQRFAQLRQEIYESTGDARSVADVAAGFIEVAVNTMAQAIKKISLEQGHDVREYTLCSFGGAGGQHACLIAEALGMAQVYIHPYAGVLSAYGIGQAELRVLKEQTIEQPLIPDGFAELQGQIERLKAQVVAELAAQGVDPSQIQSQVRIGLGYIGTDTTLWVPWSDQETMAASFAQAHCDRYGFNLRGRSLRVGQIAVEAVALQAMPSVTVPAATGELIPLDHVPVYSKGQWHQAPVYARDRLPAHQVIAGVALILDTTGTNVVEAGWQAKVDEQGGLWLRPLQALAATPKQIAPTVADPVQLGIFQQLFRAIAEQMGVTLQQTSASVNIKERLDFSCALFDGAGNLVANAPHIPVHLGSMSESVKALLAEKNNALRAGQVFATNNPYRGGTHLPDITVITPVFLKGEAHPAFFVASRGHHADIGGISPGSMPANSTDVRQEGILFDNVLLVDGGEFQGEAIYQLLTQGPWPARYPEQNIADLQAQIAANQRGAQELIALCDRYGRAVVAAYMEFSQANAAECVRQCLRSLPGGRFCVAMDNGSQIQVQITIDTTQGVACLDFAGTSKQTHDNFNAPLAITKAAVLYVLRTLVQEDIPLNAGCLRPIELRVPEGCLLNPTFPAAVVAGNVETSQTLANALYGALGIMAAAQGTMNNLSFGSDRYQYYETICGGAGAGATFAGASTVQTHMTNSRLTDVEVLESRYPVIVWEFCRRRGSGGKGQQSGGDGAIRVLEFREPMTVSLLSQSRKIPPFGLFGGEGGAVGENQWLKPGAPPSPLPGTATITVAAGDRLRICTPGGGGFGVPHLSD
ncbi:hydrantoinase/oxoprolinase family protein [Thermosynechococcus sp. NK55a]|jgi:5-oxoprolinase (ATP-hydrolysing)|uniref:hydantoinase B/oxoprolinase family protein n=1 Tax=Thermosynechococcus sp. NK55a TaxID=1394889 RepID=UPI0003D802BE|nr:hydantoinase B/oxoprolinase family protein [Thermosynechococcus sp. NK55a]AHB88793.1 hydrantoinase/oxoprolinase family protein [Thermosynechococcus sp. NK55a]